MKSTVSLYKLGNGFIATPLFVSQKHIDAGFNGVKPGIYFMRGAWYGKDLSKLSTFGKVEGMKKHWRGDCKYIGEVARFKGSKSVANF